MSCNNYSSSDSDDLNAFFAANRKHSSKGDKYRLSSGSLDKFIVDSDCSEEELFTSEKDDDVSKITSELSSLSVATAAPPPLKTITFSTSEDSSNPESDPGPSHWNNDDEVFIEEVPETEDEVSLLHNSIETRTANRNISKTPYLHHYIGYIKPLSIVIAILCRGFPITNHKQCLPR